MKEILEIIPKPNPVHGMWIFVTGCIVGAAATIGGILLHKHTEIRDGCVIIRSKGKSEQDFPPEAQQRDGAGEPEAGNDKRNPSG